MRIPTYREIAADLMRRRFGRRPSKGSHMLYSDGRRSCILSNKYMGKSPTRGLYSHICNELGFEPGMEGK